MKKLISLLAAISIVSACSLSAFAMDFTVGDGTLSAAGNADTKIEKGDNKLYNVNLTELAGGQDQTTILAVKGNAITVGSIQYIGQSATPSFSFDLKDELGSDKVYVLAGGSTLTPTVVGYMQASTAPSTFTISGTVTGYAAGKTLPVVKMVSADNKEYVGTVLDGGAYTISNVPAGEYTFTITKAAHITYTSPLTISADKAVSDIALISGDTNNDFVVDVSDFTAVGVNFGTALGITGDDFVKSADTNDDDCVDVSDFTAIGVNFGKSASTNYTNIK